MNRLTAKQVREDRKKMHRVSYWRNKSCPLCDSGMKAKKCCFPKAQPSLLSEYLRTLFAPGAKNERE